jgi:MoaA/NifB/PqqE/SkfB family radical SAM enzyme/membrane protein YqaA with SNARE-associated domain
MSNEDKKAFLPVRRATVFGLMLIALGLLALYFRIYKSHLHPQLILFIYSIPANSAISLFSHEVALIDYGAHQPVFLSTLTATLGTIVAGFLDWHIFVPLLNWEKAAAYRRYRLYRYCIDHFNKAPFIVILVTGFTPIPFFPFKFLAFSVKYPLRKYLAALILARSPRYYILAWLGSNFSIPGWVLITAFLAIFIPALWEQFGGVRRSKKAKVNTMKTSLAVKMAPRYLANLVVRKPICVSFEVTHSCPANCRHCDKGGLKKESGLMSLDDYRRLSRELLPVACQLSGGEPLLRDDLEEVARAIKRPSGLPMMVCVTNGWLFSEERYLSLINAGVNIFSVSLDFPDERHDDFRRLKGLYKKLNGLIPYLAQKYKLGNITLNCALTRSNFTEIPQLVKQAEEWGVNISFSAYSILRTGNPSYCISREEELECLERNIEFLREHKKRAGTVLNSNQILKNTIRFFREGEIPNCLAGIRFLVVRPSGLINPCSMFGKNQYRSQKEVVEDFTANNTCGQCYVAIRALTERPFRQMVLDSIGSYLLMRQTRLARSS